MPLWGTTATAATNKPKHLTNDVNSPYDVTTVYADNSGWVQRPGAGSGNNNKDAQPEILVAIGGLAGATDTTGLRAPTVTSMRYVVGTTATTDMTAGASAQRILVEVTWDEGITVAGSPQIVIDNGNQSGGGYGDHTLTYIASGSTANRKRFIATSRSLGNTDVLTIGGTNLALNSGTISDTVRGGTAQAASLVLSGLTAITHTVAA